MLLQKQGFPEEDDMLLCTVTAVHHHSVFVKLEEYGKSGLIHISEVSPGRIRNIRDYVKEGKVIVCKVLRINKDRGHIDLSLRRVNEGQRRNKMEEIKKEQFAEKVIQGVAKQFNVNGEQLYKKIYGVISNEYDLVYPYLESLSEGSEDVAKLDLDDQIAKSLVETVADKIKPEVIHIQGRFTLRSYAEDGLQRIQSTLVAAEKTCKDAAITYEGAGNYKVRVESTDFKDAEKKLSKIVDQVTQVFEKNNDFAQFARVEE
jgi:translation initiation factor 2 subunit 1